MPPESFLKPSAHANSNILALPFLPTCLQHHELDGAADDRAGSQHELSGAHGRVQQVSNPTVLATWSDLCLPCLYQSRAHRLCLSLMFIIYHVLATWPYLYHAIVQNTYAI